MATPWLFSSFRIFEVQDISRIFGSMTWAHFW